MKEYTITLQVVVQAKDYDEAVEIAKNVRAAANESDYMLKFGDTDIEEEE